MIPLKIGFKALQSKLESKGYSKDAAGAISYKVGEEKYGKKGMERKAKMGMLKKKKEDK